MFWFNALGTNEFMSHSLSQKGFDVFNALDLMENKTFLEKLKFGIGDGNLQYYLYNWKCPSMGSEKVCTFAATFNGEVKSHKLLIRRFCRSQVGLVLQ